MVSIVIISSLISVNFGRLVKCALEGTDELVYGLEGGGAEVTGSGLVGGFGRLAASGGLPGVVGRVVEDPPAAADSAPYALVGVGADGISRPVLEVLEDGYVVV